MGTVKKDRPAPVVYLDIDGVLQPLSSQDRFEHDLKALKQQMIAEVDPGYTELNRYDIGAVQHDWHPRAVENLKTLCAQSSAHIVVSSAWRDDKTLGQLKLLFRIHGLDHLIIGETPHIGPRDLEIQEHLVAHPEITRFVIIDDHFLDDLGARFPRHFVHTRHHFDAEALEKALAILRRRPPAAKEKALVAAFDALSRGDPALTSLALDLEEISLLRRRLGLSRHDFLAQLCAGVAVCPGLASLTVRGLRNEVTWRERESEDPVAALTRAAAQNPALASVNVAEASPHGSTKRRFEYF